jgi:hypothetical protein
VAVCFVAATLVVAFTETALAEAGFVDADPADAELARAPAVVFLAAAALATARFLAARWWRSRAIRFWAWVLSVTSPLDLGLVVVLVLDVRAKDAPEKIRAETTKTKRRSRNVIAITTTCYRGNSCCPYAMVRQNFHRVQR